MTVFHHAVADDDVLRGDACKAACGTSTSVGIAAALDGDAVIARVEGTAFDEYILTALGVAAVAVRAFVPNLYIAHDNVFRKEGMHHPERRINHRYSFDEDAVALVEVHQLRTESLAGAEDAFVHIHSVFGIFQQVGTSAWVLLLFRNYNVAALGRLSTHQPPCVIRTVAVDGAFTRQRNVGLLVGINQWLVVPAVESFPAGGDVGVERTVEGKHQAGVFFDDKVHAALHGDGTSVPHTGRNDDLATACLRTRVDGFVDSCLVLFGRSFR